MFEDASSTSHQGENGERAHSVGVYKGVRRAAYVWGNKPANHVAVTAVEHETARVSSPFLLLLLHLLLLLLLLLLLFSLTIEHNPPPYIPIIQCPTPIPSSLPTTTSTTQCAMGPTPVRDLLKAENEHAWIVGGRYRLQQHKTEVPDYLWVSQDQNYFTISSIDRYEGPLASSQPFPLVYDVGDAHAIWDLGEVFLKITVPRAVLATREHVTIEAVRNMRQPGFAVPKVLFHGEWDGRYFLILSRVPGQTLNAAWPSMSHEERANAASQTAAVCEALAIQERTTIGGVDRNYLPDAVLASSDEDFSPERLLRTCLACGMDTTTFVFYHCELSPQNVLYNAVDKTIGIIDWEIAGYVPRQWVRTKARVSLALDFDDPQDEEPRTWRGMLQSALGERGFEEVAEKFVAWYASEG